MTTHYPAPSFETKICPFEALPQTLTQRIDQLPRPIVFTNGVFDILHRGHVTYLAQARALGASLVVAINTDASVKRLGKGDDRPINTELDRAAVIAALECVQLVTLFAEDTPLVPLQIVRPDIYVKGGDYTIATLPEAPLVQSWGGQIHLIPFEHQRSTTNMLQKIRGG